MTHHQGLSKKENSKEFACSCRTGSVFAGTLADRQKTEAFVIVLRRDTSLFTGMSNGQHFKHENVRVTTEDDKAICDLVKAITASSSANANGVLSWLFPPCWTNIVQWIMKLHEAVTAFSDDLEAVLKQYHPANFADEEFSNSAEYRKRKYSGDVPPFSQIMHDLLAEIIVAGRAFRSGDPNLSAELYAELAKTAIILQKSRRLCWASHGFPDMEERWRNSLLLMTRVHPEISIMLDLSTPFNSLDLWHEQPIGSNKRACMCGTIWIRICKLQFGARWLMSRTSGKADPTWAFPDCSYEHAIAWGEKSTVNEAVQHGVQRCLTTSLYSLISDPSDPENNEAKAIWDVMKMRCDGYLKDAVDCGKLLMKRIIKPFKRQGNT
ncbi:hypothetical protein EDC04DRAFT_3089641 [Pisolithus marmoratus]|nr:hypothetical protein EDC04DRAFT_3089641 [Pisolithus marmoratus]